MHQGIGPLNAPHRVLQRHFLDGYLLAVGSAVAWAARTTGHVPRTARLAAGLTLSLHEVRISSSLSTPSPFTSASG